MMRLNVAIQIECRLVEIPHWLLFILAPVVQFGLFLQCSNVVCKLGLLLSLVNKGRSSQSSWQSQRQKEDSSSFSKVI